MSLWHRKLAIILPTFNESKNLRFLLNKINSVVPDAHVFIVDDSYSTENLQIKKIAKKYTNVEVLTRQKKLGRGSAVLFGFAYALQNKKLEYFVEMDTDLAHDPQELPLLFKSFKKADASVVIGSRYIDDSKIVNWPLRRLVMSKIINFFLNIWLGLKLHDYTNGYRMYQRKAVEHLVKAELKEKNFIALSESAFILRKKGFRITEVPITFTDRKHGESSVGVKELFASLVGAFRIRLRYNFNLNQKNNKPHPNPLLKGEGISREWFPLSKLQAIVLLLVLATALRFWNLNDMGKTWDESAYVESGYFMTEAIRKGDFDEPLLYLSDHPPLARYFFGVAEQLQVGIDHKPGSFPYDYTYARLVSLVFSLLSIVLVFLLGWNYISPFVGFTAGLILSMLPFFLGFSQLATLESFIMFFFTASVYSFLTFLQTRAKKWVVLTGIATGLALLVKQSNVLILPLLAMLHVCHSWRQTRNPFVRRSPEGSWIPAYAGMTKKIAEMTKVLIPIVFISIVTFFAFWPFALFHAQEVLHVQDTMWVKHVALPPPEVFFGRLMLVPLPYYVVFFFITTPVLILLFFSLGLFRIRKLRTWTLLAIVIWFLFPFLQSFYTFKQHGIRYIIEIYAPMALIAAIGFETLIYSLTTKRLIKILSLVILFLYMFFILFKATPYYLDYFNGIVGGTNGVYEKRLFQLGWWGQGLKDAGMYIDQHAKKGETIGLAAKPNFSFPTLKDHPSEYYNPKKTYDYIVVSYFVVLREGFDDSVIKQKYKPVHTVYADKAPIVVVYKRGK